MECLSAAVLAGAWVLAVGLLRLSAGFVPHCALKTWTGVPCVTCGGTRAIEALLHAQVASAFRLQPLLAGLAITTMVWIGYAIAGALFGLSRIRVQTTRREKILFVAGAAALVLANWAYLIMDGR